MKTTIKCEAWTSEKFSPETTFLFPGINLGRAQSGQQTNSKLMKNKPNKVTEILSAVLGITEANYVESAHSLAVVDAKLG